MKRAPGPSRPSLTKLTDLDLSHNKIKRLPPELVNLPHLKRLYLEGNHLQDPPQEIADRGLQAIQNFFRQRETQKTVQLWESRLLIVGQPGAGKTSLMRKLLDETYLVKPGGQDSTTGVNIATWSFPLDKYKSQEFRAPYLGFRRTGNSIRHPPVFPQPQGPLRVASGRPQATYPVRLLVRGD